jgi:DNA invertase Pin-like site-specific DNA recombinase
LARNAKDLLTIVESITNAGASLNILDLGINTGTPVGKMIITVLGAVSELERSYINDRTRLGVKRYIEKGGKMGPKTNPKRDKHIKALGAGGQHSWSEIAEEVGVSRQTVYRVLRPNKAKEHREADMTRYYKGKGKTPSPAKTSEEAKKATMKGAQKRKSD